MIKKLDYIFYKKIEGDLSTNLLSFFVKWYTSNTQELTNLTKSQQNKIREIMDDKSSLQDTEELIGCAHLIKENFKMDLFSINLYSFTKNHEKGITAVFENNSNFYLTEIKANPKLTISSYKAQVNLIVKQLDDNLHDQKRHFLFDQMIEYLEIMEPQLVQNYKNKKALFIKEADTLGVILTRIKPTKNEILSHNLLNIIITGLEKE